MDEVALIGDPVGHSLSPAIQEAAFAARDLDWHYRLVRVPRGGLARAWPNLRQRFRGANVTSPHKEEAARLADRLSPAAERCASVNTICFEVEGAVGDSTDGAGFLAALDAGGGGCPSRAVVLGTGGVARAVAAALLAVGTEVLVVGRNEQAGLSLVGDLEGGGPGRIAFGGDGATELAAALNASDLVVNATILGGPSAPQFSPVPDQVALRPGLVVFDLVYWPRHTPLRRRARAEGCRVIDALEMLVQQGALSFQAWTGLEAPLEVMRQAARRAVAVLA